MYLTGKMRQNGMMGGEKNMSLQRQNTQNIADQSIYLLGNDESIERDTFKGCALI